jgi:hypothetical protein
MSITVITDSERLIPAAIYPLIKIEKTGDLLYGDYKRSGTRFVR